MPLVSWGCRISACNSSRKKEETYRRRCAMRLVTDSARSTPPGGADRAVLAAERRRQAGCCGIRSSTRGRSSWCTRPYLGEVIACTDMAPSDPRRAGARQGDCRTREISQSPPRRSSARSACVTSGRSSSSQSRHSSINRRYCSTACVRCPRRSCISAWRRCEGPARTDSGK
jgi:hypothetical protein